MTTPAPRPALRKAPDAHIHPAAPSAPHLRPAPDRDQPESQAPSGSPAPSGDAARVDTPPGIPRSDGPRRQGRLSGPPRGTTSDSLRAAAKRSRRRSAPPVQEKSVELTVRIPKSLRKELRAALKNSKRTPDDVVTALLRSWLDT